MEDIKETKVCETGKYSYWKQQCRKFAEGWKFNIRFTGDKDIDQCIFWGVDSDGNPVDCLGIYAEWDGTKGEITLFEDRYIEQSSQYSHWTKIGPV